MNRCITAEKAITAYGGAELWKNHKFIEAKVSVKGLAFTLKRRPFFKHAKIKMEIARPFSKITPIGKDSSVSGILDGNDVRLESPNGNIISEKKRRETIFLTDADFFIGTTWIWLILPITRFGIILHYPTC